MDKKIVLLCSEGFSTTVLYNYISRFYPVERVIAETPMRGMSLAKRRINKLGWPTVAAQVAFMAAVVPVLRRKAAARLGEIRSMDVFDETPIPAAAIQRVDSVNDSASITLLQQLDPDVVLVNGTRIISKKVLDSVRAKFINMHTGITPKYRGVHGGYWAMKNDDPVHCGVTVHLVDKGIDTGAVLHQALIHPNAQDNFVTYPYLQYAAGLPLVKQAVDDLFDGKL
ncbi:MAG: formyl transferase, partial [Chitinophagaceae bacterium]